MRTSRRVAAVVGAVVLGGGIWIIIASPLASFRIVGAMLMAIAVALFLHHG